MTIANGHSIPGIVSTERRSSWGFTESSMSRVNPSLLPSYSLPERSSPMPPRMMPTGAITKRKRWTHSHPTTQLNPLVRNAKRKTKTPSPIPARMPYHSAKPAPRSARLVFSIMTLPLDRSVVRTRSHALHTRDAEHARNV